MMTKSKQSSLKSLRSVSPLVNKPISKQGLRISKPRNNNEDQGDIVTKTCCPNCRFIFKVVNENKLNALKKKLQNLQSIQQQKVCGLSSRSYVVKSPQNVDKKQSRNQTPKISTPINQTPKDSLKRQQILSKSIAEESVVSKSKTSNTNKSSKIMGTQTIQPLLIQTPRSRKSPGNLTERSFTKKQYSKTPDKQKRHNGSNVKSPTITGRKNQLQKVGDSIQQDIMQMKKYLRSTAELKQKYDRQQNNAINLLSPKNSYHNHSQMQTQSPNKKNMKKELDKISELSKSRHQIVINRKCQACSVAQVDKQLAFRAGTSVLLQQQMNMIAKYIEKSTSTPSYIKCLQQIVSQND